MQFFTLVLSALAATSLAAPTHPEPTTTACGGAGCSWTTTTKPAVPTTTKAPGCGGQGCEWTSTTVHPSTTTTAGNGGGGGGYNPCANEGLYKVAQCCATDVLGLADLDCQNPTSVPSSPSNFQQTCKAVGQRARCCLLPILGQALVCKTPTGVN